MIVPKTGAVCRQTSGFSLLTISDVRCRCWEDVQLLTPIMTEATIQKTHAMPTITRALTQYFARPLTVEATGLKSIRKASLTKLVAIQRRIEIAMNNAFRSVPCSSLIWLAGAMAASDASRSKAAPRKN